MAAGKLSGPQHCRFGNLALSFFVKLRINICIYQASIEICIC